MISERGCAVPKGKGRRTDCVGGGKAGGECDRVAVMGWELRKSGGSVGGLGREDVR